MRFDGWAAAAMAGTAAAYAFTSGFMREMMRARRSQQVEDGTRVLPVRQSHDPIPAIKLAYPVVIGGQLRWHALYREHVYGNEEEAECPYLDTAETMQVMVRFQVGRRLVTPEEHGPPPMLEYRCGFYAMDAAARRSHLFRVTAAAAKTVYARRKGADLPPSYAVLDVELAGRVIVGEKGYRAQRQRVMKAHLDGRCAKCARTAKGFYAGTFIVGSGADAALSSTCGCQMPVMWDLQDVRNMAGTEVVFDRDRQPLLTALLHRA